MSIELFVPSADAVGAAVGAQAPTLLDRLRERRRVEEQDRRSSRLAELHRLRGIVGEAAELVETDWVRDGWFRYVDQRGRRRVATALTAHHAEGRPIVGACLVGSIVHAGGGLSEVRSQPVQRSLDLVWHALHRPDEAVRFSPSPQVRQQHLRELTRWNDNRKRTQADVVALLGRAGLLAQAERDRLG